MKYCIIGGDAAGMSAAMQIVRRDPEATITVFERGDIYSYGQCGLPYTVSGLISSTDNLIARSVATFRERYHIDARTCHEVTSIDSHQKIVFGVHTKTGEAFSHSYDKLLIASGASPVMPEWEGNHLPGIHTIKTIPDTNRLINDLTPAVREVVIIGGGYIGLEMAENLHALGKNVSIIQRGNHLGNMFDEDMAQSIHQEAEKHGISLYLQEEVKRFKGHDRVQFIKTNKRDLPADLVVVAVGITPNVSFLENDDIHLHDNGAILVNHYMETNLKDIYAAGDCATQYHLVKEMDDYIPLGTHANKQGRIAGINMAGGHQTFKGVVGSSIVKFMDLALGKTGINEREASELQFSVEAITTESKDIAGYYPDAQPLTVKLLYNKSNQRLLGGQIIGYHGVDKRVDVLATALYNKMDFRELEDLDLCYAPPFNSVWDPIQQVARRAKN